MCFYNVQNPSLLLSAHFYYAEFFLLLSHCPIFWAIFCTISWLAASSCFYSLLSLLFPCFSILLSSANRLRFIKLLLPVLYLTLIKVCFPGLSKLILNLRNLKVKILCFMFFTFQVKVSNLLEWQLFCNLHNRKRQCILWKPKKVNLRTSEKPKQIIRNRKT